MPDYLSKLPYFVLDQNRCRHAETVQELFRRCKQDGLAILLPDTAVYEFSNVARPDITWSRSLEHLCKEPELVFAGRSIGQLMKEEIQAGKPITDLVDHEVTPRFQRLLTELRGGDDKRVKLALAEVARFIDDEKNLREQHSDNKAVVTSLRQEWQKTLPKDDLKLLRKPDEATFVRILAEPKTATIVFHAAKNDGCTDELAYALTISPSVYGHTVYALAALALDWLAQGGLEGTDPEKITNDFFDLDYIVTATFCTDLVTIDARAKRVHSALIKAFDQRAQWISSTESETCERNEWVEVNAYFRWINEGRHHGHHARHWTEAEKEYEERQ